MVRLQMTFPFCSWSIFRGEVLVSGTVFFDDFLANGPVTNVATCFTGRHWRFAREFPFSMPLPVMKIDKDFRSSRWFHRESSATPGWIIA